MPGLRRSHEHHRNLHARLDAAIPTAAAANCDQDRYVVITSPCYRFKIPIVLAGRRSATAALVQICFCDLNMAIDLPGLRQIPAPAADQSCAQSRQPMHSWPAVAITQLRRPQILITNGPPPPTSHFPRFRSLKFPSDFAGPAVHETFATLRRRRHRGRYSLGAIKPDLKLDPGFPHLEMRLDHHRRASVRCPTLCPLPQGRRRGDDPRTRAGTKGRKERVPA